MTTFGCLAYGDSYESERYLLDPNGITIDLRDLELRRLSRREGTLSDALLAEIGRLRLMSWEADGARSVFASDSAAGWTDSHDEHATHFVIVADEMMIGAARQCVHIEGEPLPDAEVLGDYANAGRWPAAFWNRLVVHPDFWGRRYSGILDNARLESAEQVCARSIFATCHIEHRVSKLARLGFRRLGEAPHRHIPSRAEFVFIKSMPSRLAD
jgi:hypothetical protein